MLRLIVIALAVLAFGALVALPDIIGGRGSRPIDVIKVREPTGPSDRTREAPEEARPAPPASNPAPAPPAATAPEPAPVAPAPAPAPIEDDDGGDDDDSGGDD